MLRATSILKSKTRLVSLIAVLSVFLVITTAFAATKLIVAEDGGVVDIDTGVSLVIYANALSEDTVISATMVKDEDTADFEFGPSGTQFSTPAELCISWQVISDAESLTLYGESGEVIQPQIQGWGVKYPIEHFSLYYYRRR
jgi:hypothetical protein